MKMKVDLRKTTKRLLTELEAHCFEENQRLESLEDPSTFEKGRQFAHLEIAYALHRIMYKER